MAADHAVHPEPQVLQAFALGKLSDPETAHVSRHLETCASCRQRVKTVPADSFLGKVQAAQPRGTATQLPQALPSRSGGDTALAGGTSVPTTVPPPVPPELAGHGKFRIVKELGRGGMGVVYLAEHRVMERPVAIKVMSQAILDHPEALARFHAEVKAAAKLNHPNIVQAHDADQSGALHMLVMEFVEGVSLADYLKRKGPLPIGLACHFVRQAALGLQHAHERGMVHRDIKPNNLMVTPKGQVKILDFGLARLASERGQQSRLTRLGAFMGTPDYMAPEQANDARAADIRADLYSLGCTLYCLLAGRPPFQEDTDLKLFLAHQEKEPAPLPELRPDVPEALGAVVRRLLAKDPAARYQTPAELAKELQPFAKVGPRSGPEAPPRPAPAMSAPGRGTMIATDTSNAPPRRPAADAPPPSADPASPFADLDAAAPPPAKAKPAAKPQPPRRSRRRLLVGGAAAFAGVTVLAGITIWVQLKWEGGKTETTVQMTYESEPAPKPPPAPVQLPPPPSADGFQPLFNGKDLTGWQTKGEGKWRIEPDGSLAGRGEGALLYTDRGDYRAPFTLRVVLVAAPETEAFVGVKLRPDGPTGWQGVSSGIFATKNTVKAGLLRDNFIAQEWGIKPQECKPGQPFTLVLNAVNEEVWASVEGVTTAGVKFSNHPAGRIGLLVRKGALTVQRIEVREPAPPPAGAPTKDLTGFVPLFNGKNLTGWERPIQDAGDWFVTKEGELVGKGGGAGKPAFLSTVREDFRDLHLRVEAYNPEFKNKFVMTRCSFEGNSNGYCIAVGGLDNKENRIVPGTIGWFPTDTNPGRPFWQAGVNVPDPTLYQARWFEIAVILRGKKIITFVDNVKVDEVEADVFSSGRIALNCRGDTEVRYRNIRVKELPPTQESSGNQPNVKPRPSAVGTWEGTFANGSTATFLVADDKTMTGSNGFRGRWDQTGLTVTVIGSIVNRPENLFKGEIDATGQTMRLVDKAGIPSTYKKLK